MPDTHNAPSVVSWQKFSNRGIVANALLLAFAATAIACGGSSDVTGPGGGGGPTPVATVAVSAPNSQLLIGVTDSVALGTTTATAIPKSADGSTLSSATVGWSSSATTVATVSSAGIITAIGEGTADIIATSGGKTGLISVTVSRPAVGQITVVPQNSSIKVGATEALAVTLLDANAHQLTHRLISTVNNSPAIITVSAGTITGVSAGNGTVNFSSEGITTVATITVTP